MMLVVIVLACLGAFLAGKRTMSWVLDRWEVRHGRHR